MEERAERAERSGGALARLDRHALVMALWLPAGSVAAILLHHGFAGAGLWWVAAGFAVLLGGFAGHVVVNAVLATGFGPREVGVGLVLYLAALVALAVAVLAVDGFFGAFFLTVAAGMAALACAVVVYMVTRHGARAAFEKFDIVRDNNPRPSSRLRHPGKRP